MQITAGRLGVLLAAAAATLASLAPAALAAEAMKISVVSNRADLVSGGDALLELHLPRGVSLDHVRVTHGRRNVTGAFEVTADGRVLGLVDGLRLGRNEIVARAKGAKPGRAVIVNHPNGGPVFSGPQIQPWRCQPTAVDEQCNEPPRYSFHYRSTGGEWKRYDPANPPGDVAMTTTQNGTRVPFIVRVETGYQNRDQYKIAVLYQPDKPWTAARPQEQWVHKLLITHGASCGIERRAGSAPSVFSDTLLGESPTVALGLGFAVMSTALDNAGHNCNVVTQAESLMMAKERLIEQYGTLRYTIGTGCSGGSLAQQQVANAYPGIYQGILPACSFPDAWSTGQQLAAYNLLRRYLENPGMWAPGVNWDPLSIAAVEGHLNHINSIVFDTIYWTDLGVPDDGCAGVSDEQVYDPETNPGGVRCTLADYMINVLGPRAEELWGPQERALGRGFAGLPIGDEGVQFGLGALKKGQITPEQFVDLNAKVGGVDIDIRPTRERLRATEPHLSRAYRSGAINQGNNLDQVAIIDLRGPDPGLFHDAYRSWATRARIEREHGHHRNHVIWFGLVPIVGDLGYPAEALRAMDRWLAAVEADTSDRPLADKIVANRPPDVQDRCAQIPGLEQVVLPGIGRVCELELLQTRFGTPATVAGEPISTDQNQCRLKPLRRADYYPITFTEDQWRRLERTFPNGVCDWSKPGVGQQGTIPWQAYQRGVRGKVIYGGRPLGPAPGRSGTGWASPAFASWRRAIPGGVSGAAERARMAREARERARRRRERAQRRERARERRERARERRERERARARR